jgi:hypothetical protein
MSILFSVGVLEPRFLLGTEREGREGGSDLLKHIYVGMRLGHSVDLGTYIQIERFLMVIGCIRKLSTVLLKLALVLVHFIAGYCNNHVKALC